MNLAAFRNWFWAGTPERRLIVHLLLSAIVFAVPLGSLGGQSTGLLIGLVSWDFGAWYMDRIYQIRLATRQIAPTQ